jgi:hypothetical protein
MLHTDRKRWLRRSLVVTSLAVLATACGSDSDSTSTAGAPTTASGGPASSAATGAPPTTSGGTTSSGGCPISADALSTATSLRWEQRDRQENRPMETNPSIRSTVCIFTAGAALQQGGDPLVFRTDVVTGSGTSTVRQEFSTTCTSISGATKASGGGTVCDVKGVVVEGYKGEGDRVVLAGLVNADNSTAASLTTAFSKVMDALR